MKKIAIYYSWLIKAAVKRWICRLRGEPWQVSRTEEFFQNPRQPWNDPKKPWNQKSA